MYDIYLISGCKAIPELNDFEGSFPEFGTYEFSKRLMDEFPGFLGLTLTADLARKLIRRLKYTSAKARGMIIPCRYRKNKPRVTIQDAFAVADDALKKMQVKHPDVVFGETVHDTFRDSLMYFTFVSPAKQWLDEGLIPGALFVNVDKIDGHVWTSEEHMSLRDDIE